MLNIVYLKINSITDFTLLDDEHKKSLLSFFSGLQELSKDSNKLYIPAIVKYDTSKKNGYLGWIGVRQLEEFGGIEEHYEFKEWLDNAITIEEYLKIKKEV